MEATEEELGDYKSMRGVGDEISNDSEGEHDRY